MAMVTGYSRTPGTPGGVRKVSSDSREMVLMMQEPAESKLELCYPLYE